MLIRSEGGIDKRWFTIDDELYVFEYGTHVSKVIRKYDPFDLEEPFHTYYETDRIPNKNKYVGMLVLRNAFRYLIEYITHYKTRRFCLSTYGDSSWKSLFTRFSKIIEDKYEYLCFHEGDSFDFYKNSLFDE